MNILTRTYEHVCERLGQPALELGRICPDTPNSMAWNRALEIPANEVLQPMTAVAPSISGPWTEGGLDDRTYLSDDGLHEIGMEAVAFYKSFRFQDMQPFKGYWGIFYLVKGIRNIRERLEYRHIPHAHWSALEFVRRHERFHFKFDVYALGIESATSKHLYLPLKYKYQHHHTMQTEEALANHEAWRWASTQGPVMVDFARDLMSRQPAAYARFAEPREELASELAANLIDLNLAFRARRDDQAMWVGNIPAAMAHWQSYCLEYWVIDQGEKIGRSANNHSALA